MIATYDKLIYAIELVENGKTSYLPCYTCGHCSSIVVLNKDRTRERKKCLQCMKLVCETNEICRTDCIPLADLCRDHFEGATEKWLPYVNAIMKGATTLSEVEQPKGVVNG